MREEKKKSRREQLSERIEDQNGAEIPHGHCAVLEWKKLDKCHFNFHMRKHKYTVICLLHQIIFRFVAFVCKLTNIVSVAVLIEVQTE